MHKLSVESETGLLVRNAEVDVELSGCNVCGRVGVDCEVRSGVGNDNRWSDGDWHSQIPDLVERASLCIGSNVCELLHDSQIEGSPCSGSTDISSSLAFSHFDGRWSGCCPISKNAGKSAKLDSWVLAETDNVSQ